MAPITPLRVVTVSFLLIAANAVTVSESASAYTLANDRVSFNALKKNGYIQHLAIDRISVLGTPSGNAGQLYTGQRMCSRGGFSECIFLTAQHTRLPFEGLCVDIQSVI